MSQAKFDELRTRLAEIADLVKTASILGWDQHVMMPPRGAAIRAEQMATVGRIAHQKFTSAEIGKMIGNSEKTIKQHLTQVYAKLGVAGRAEFFHLVFPS